MALTAQAETMPVGLSAGETPEEAAAASSETVREAVAACQRGEREAFDQLVVLYQRDIYRLCYRYVNNHEDANDLTQEAAAIDRLDMSLSMLAKLLAGTRTPGMISSVYIEDVTGIRPADWTKTPRPGPLSPREVAGVVSQTTRSGDNDGTAQPAAGSR